MRPGGQRTRLSRGVLAAAVAAALALLLTAPTPQTHAERASRHFWHPGAIAVDVSGRVYVAGVAGTLRAFRTTVEKFTSRGALIDAMWGPAGSPVATRYGVAGDSVGHVYVSDPYRNLIRKLDSHGAQLGGWELGFGSSPDDLATDAAGNLYVVDGPRDEILKFAADGTPLAEWSLEGLGSGSSITLGPAGSVYVALSVGAQIQKLSPTGRVMTIWGGFGHGNGQFWGPEGIATDSAGYVYVADTKNNRIQKFTADGAFVTKWGSYGSGRGQFKEPSGVATDRTGDVYVADVYNGRVEKFDPSGKLLAQWGSNGKQAPKRLIIPTTTRKAIFHARCTLARRCRARVRISAGKRILARGRYSVPAHSNRKVAIPLTKAGRTTLRRRHRAPAKLTVVDTRTHRRERIAVVLTTRGA